jgi:hypothetical protein
MQIEFLVNDGVQILLSPENEMEEHLLKQMMKQNNEMNEIRSSVVVLNKTFRNGILIGKKTLTASVEVSDKAPELPVEQDEDNKETL